MEEEQRRKNNDPCYNPDDFIAILASKDTGKIRDESEVYTQLTDHLGVPRNEKKDRQATVISIFDIEVDPSTLTMRMPEE